MDFLAALCQVSPSLGDLEANFALHHAQLDAARAAGAQLAVFPELSLTGYSLKDLTQEVALKLDDPRLQDLWSRSTDCSFLIGLVEESRDHQFFNSMVFAEGGKVQAVHRKVHLPDYGIFEEGRYFAKGDGFYAFDSRLGRFGIIICEDLWHPTSAWLHYLQGIDALLVPAASPARGIAVEGSEMGSQRLWRTLLAAQTIHFQCWALYCNRVGFEDGAMFWGGSLVMNPFGHAVAEAKGEVEEMLLHRMDADAVRRARVFSPLRRDAQPETIRRQLAQLLNDPDAMQTQREPQ